jgi:hypothetical protein
MMDIFSASAFLQLFLPGRSVSVYAANSAIVTYLLWFYLINYGFEVYGDRYLTEDPKEHGRKVVELLQNTVRHCGVDIFSASAFLQLFLPGRSVSVYAANSAIAWWAFVLCRTREPTKPEEANDGEPDGYSGGIGQHGRNLLNFYFNLWNVYTTRQ